MSVLEFDSGVAPGFLVVAKRPGCAVDTQHTQADIAQSLLHLGKRRYVQPSGGCRRRVGTEHRLEVRNLDTAMRQEFLEVPTASGEKSRFQRVSLVGEDFLTRLDGTDQRSSRLEHPRNAAEKFFPVIGVDKIGRVVQDDLVPFFAVIELQDVDVQRPARHLFLSREFANQFKR